MNMNTGRVGKMECISLVWIGCFVSALFALNTESVFANGNSSYVSNLAAALLSLLVFFTAAGAMRHCRLRDLSELFEYAFGRAVSGLFSIVIALALLLAAVLPLGRMLIIMCRYVYVDSTIAGVAAYFLPCLVLPLFLGFESIARTGKLFLASILASFLIAFLVAAPAFETYRLYPILGDGLFSALRFSLLGTERFLPALISLMILSRSAQGAKSMIESGSIGAVSGGISASVVLLLLGMLYPYQELSIMHSPMYRITASVKTGAAYLRLDKLLLFFWTIASIITALFYVFSASLLLSKAFRVRDIRPPALAFMATAATLALAGQGNFIWYERAGAFFANWLWAFLLLPVLLASLFSAMRGGGNRT